MALHEAFEDYLVGLFEDCVLEAIHRNAEGYVHCIEDPWRGKSLQG